MDERPRTEEDGWRECGWGEERWIVKKQKLAATHATEKSGFGQAP
jgi:hypothetical protein